MKKRKDIIPTILIGCISIASAAVVSISALSLGWFSGPSAKVEEEIINGVVGLRSYFYDGDGSEDHPFEIVTPTHYYNLTRLQNLGIFPYPEKEEDRRWFELGHDFTKDADYSTNDNLWKDPTDHSKGKYTRACINIDPNTGEVYYSDYLDMGEFSTNYEVLPVGSEGTPFYGNFDGKGIPIKNLTIKGYPEDVGVFGYVSYEGSVKGLVCSNLQIHSMGYTSDSHNASHDLFSRDIDKIFGDNLDDITGLMNLKYVDNTPTRETPGILLKQPVGTGTVDRDYINSNANVAHVGDDYSYIYNGYFLPILPDPSDISSEFDFKFSWKSSSSMLKAATTEHKQSGLVISDDYLDKRQDEGGAIVIDMEDLSSSTSEDEEMDFNNGEKMRVDARISLIASVEVDGFKFSRVIQSYKISFYSNSKIYSEGGYSMSICCDYVNQNDDLATNYHHGNNIGFLAGHVDGSMTNSYVYRGSFYLNDGSGCVPIDTESESGLIGEVGTHVSNGLDPEINKTVHGNTGVMNFTKIYNNIRTDIQPNDVIKAGRYGSDGPYYVSYNNQEADASTFNLYKDYLRTLPAPNTDKYITKVSSDYGIDAQAAVGDSYLVHDYQYSAYKSGAVPFSFNSVDFAENSLIEDRAGEDRGLGVFKIVSNYNEDAKTGNYSDYWASNMGGTYINSTDKRYRVYFSTAEYIHARQNAEKQWVTVDGGEPQWGTAAEDLDILRPTTLPTYSDSMSFDYPFSRDYNYCFELDLAQMAYTGGKNYMYNTDSEFLINYLKTKLINKLGETIEYKNPRFGFMFRSSENERLDSLSSYMPISKPGDTKYFYGKVFKYNASTTSWDIQSNLLTKNGVPDGNTPGSQGDYYINTATPNTLYLKGASSWDAISAGSVKNGFIDPNGDTFTSPLEGSAGDYYIEKAFYPSNSIVFKIDNNNGANVSVIANGEDVSVYAFDSTTASGSTTKVASMRSVHANSGIDNHRYFPFNAVTGTTGVYGNTTYTRGGETEHVRETLVYPNSDNIVKVGDTPASNEPVIAKLEDVNTNFYLYETFDGKQYYSDDTTITANSTFFSIANGEATEIGVQNLMFKEANDMQDGNALYAHIFKLPKGEYCIGSKTSSKANLFFLAVQGQTNGSLDDNVTAAIGDRAVTQVDFLTSEPHFEDYDEDVSSANFKLDTALFNFKCEFSKQYTHDHFDVDVESDSIALNYTDNPPLVRYLLAMARSPENHSFYVNSDQKDVQYIEDNR